MPRLLVLLAILVGPVGCSDSLARQSMVDSLRLLAMSAEPPEALPGATVRVRALWSDPPGPASLAFRWTSCAAPDDGSVDACGGPETPLPGAGADDETVLQAAAATGTELVRLTICRGVLAADGACSGENVQGAKRVVVSDGDEPNDNPVIEELDLDGAAAGSAPVAAGARVTVSLRAAAGSAQSLDDGTTEELFVSWFATGGSFEDDRSFGPEPERFETTWRAPGASSTVTMWAVLRDRRGGVSWTAANLTVQ